MPILVDTLLDHHSRREKEKRVDMAQFDVTTLKFDNNGLSPANAQAATTGEDLLMSGMNSAAVQPTVVTREVTYW